MEAVIREQVLREGFAAAERLSSLSPNHRLGAAWAQQVARTARESGRLAQRAADWLVDFREELVALGEPFQLGPEELDKLEKTKAICGLLAARFRALGPSFYVLEQADQLELVSSFGEDELPQLAVSLDGIAQQFGELLEAFREIDGLPWREAAQASFDEAFSRVIEDSATQRAAKQGWEDLEAGKVVGISEALRSLER